MTFITDLQFGNKFQAEYIKTMIPTPLNIEIMEGYYKEYDFIADGIKYEVKSDRMTFATGNICIEYECSGKPSGISLSTADFWIYIVLDKQQIVETYKIPSSFIKSQIEAKTYTRECKGGDNWKCKLYLFKKSMFDSYKCHVKN